MKLPTISVRVSNTNVRIATGEFLFPVLVLVFCAAYYIDTRGVPDRSMMYAGPLLYTTAFLAVVTVLKHAVSLDRQCIKRERGEGNVSTQFIGWGTDEGTAIDKPEKKSRSGGFGTSSAVGLAVLLIGYLLSLYVVPFVLGTAGFLGCTLYILGERRPVRILVYSLGFTILTWVVFVEWLLVPLP